MDTRQFALNSTDFTKYTPYSTMYTMYSIEWGCIRVTRTYMGKGTMILKMVEGGTGLQRCKYFLPREDGTKSEGRGPV